MQLLCMKYYVKLVDDLARPIFVFAFKISVTASYDIALGLIVFYMEILSTYTNKHTGITDKSNFLHIGRVSKINPH